MSAKPLRTRSCMHLISGDLSLGGRHLFPTFTPDSLCFDAKRPVRLWLKSGGVSSCGKQAFPFPRSCLSPCAGPDAPSHGRSGVGRRRQTAPAERRAHGSVCGRLAERNPRAGRRSRASLSPGGRRREHINVGCSEKLGIFLGNLCVPNSLTNVGFVKGLLSNF